MSGGTAQTVRRQRNKLSRDLVLHGIRKSTFEHLTVNWNFNVLEMALKIFRFVQGLPITPLFLFLRYFKTRFRKLSSFCLSKIWKSEILKVWKRRAPKNNRDLSSQKCFNFCAVLISENRLQNRYLVTGDFAWELWLQDLRLGELGS